MSMISGDISYFCNLCFQPNFYKFYNFCLDQFFKILASFHWHNAKSVGVVRKRREERGERVSVWVCMREEKVGEREREREKEREW
jgi:hypothetical protein